MTPLQRVIIALQACVLVLNLDLGSTTASRTSSSIPGEFVPGWEWEDEAGVVHRNDDPLAGEAMPGGPVVLSWPDVEASRGLGRGGDEPRHPRVRAQDRHARRRRERLPAAARPRCRPEAWQATLSAAYDDFGARVDGGDDTAIDPYAAESPGEFFAVLSEVFFAEPALLRREYPRRLRAVRAVLPAGPGAGRAQPGGTRLRPSGRPGRTFELCAAGVSYSPERRRLPWRPPFRQRSEEDR